MFESNFKQERIAEVEGMLERAELKVQFVKSLHDFVLNLDDDSAEPINSQEFESLLKEKFNSHIEDDESLRTALDKVASAKVLSEELSTEKEQFKLVPKEEKTDEVILKRREFLNEKKTIVSEINSDPEVVYVKQILDYIEYLVALKKERDEYKDLYSEDGGALVKNGKFVGAVNEFFNNKSKELREGMKKIDPNFKGYNLGRAEYGNHLQDVIFKGLGTILVFRESARSKLKSFYNIGGKHFTNTSVSFCFNDKEKDRVLDHEYNHTLFGQLKSHTTLYGEGFIRNIKSIAEPDDATKLMKLFTSESYSTEKDLEDNILGYERQLIGEIFADLGYIFDDRLAYGFYKHFTNSMAELSEYSDGLQDEHLRDVIKNAQEKLIRSMNKYKGELAELVYLANKLDMVDDAMAGMVVFEGDARKVLRQIKGIVREEKIAPLMADYDPIKNRIYDTPDEKEGDKTI